MQLILGSRPKQCHHTSISPHFSRYDHPCSRHDAQLPPQTQILDRPEPTHHNDSDFLPSFGREVSEKTGSARVTCPPQNHWLGPVRRAASAAAHILCGWAGGASTDSPSGFPIRKSHLPNRRGSVEVNMETLTGYWVCEQVCPPRTYWPAQFGSPLKNARNGWVFFGWILH